MKCDEHAYFYTHKADYSQREWDLSKNEISSFFFSSSSFFFVYLIACIDRDLSVASDLYLYLCTRENKAVITHLESDA